MNQEGSPGWILGVRNAEMTIIESMQKESIVKIQRLKRLNSGLSGSNWVIDPVT